MKLFSVPAAPAASPRGSTAALSGGSSLLPLIHGVLPPGSMRIPRVPASTPPLSSTQQPEPSFQCHPNHSPPYSNPPLLLFIFKNKNRPPQPRPPLQAPSLLPSLLFLQATGCCLLRPYTCRCSSPGHTGICSRRDLQGLADLKGQPRLAFSLP